MTTRYVDLPTEGTSVGTCVVLPGRQYTPDGPLLFFAAQVALTHGWNVRQVWWEASERFSQDVHEEVAWVCAELAAATEDVDGPVLVVGKSLGTLAGALAAERGYDAAWLTPLLTEPDLAGTLLSYPARQYVVIGEDDPYLSRQVFDALPGERLLVPGDHVLRVPGDPAAMVASHDRFVRSFDAWLSAASP